MVSADPGRTASNQPHCAAPEEAPPTGTTAVLLELGFDGDSLSGVRSAVAAQVAAIPAGRLVDTMMLIAHELASNAVRHGGGSGRLRLWLTGGALHCGVSDAGPGLEEPASAGRVLPALSLPGGRGLWIARQMSDLRIVSSPRGTTVTATLPL
ncbi:ATP-binding protein [Actinoplanes sp. NPDC049118]|uniref:ATP-binding protein n=1 Tax=Actinoplanes sp. NPDC049118 TaxID=3155769 RepID=UPI0033C05763